MAKKRKTRQEKISSDLRPHSASLSSSGTFSYSAPTNSKGNLPNSSSIAGITSIHTNDYSYVGKDLIHTALITGAIILVELVIFFFIRSV
ncbi:MAG: hypothetical protein KBC15_02260 [Candidatus Levybacteria bacterium]|nr:hypothetical protein [Candidatus Levybacteria bacterium]